ncbi:MAG: glycosyltransferase family 4 protein [Armatimonadetes bacterium]|nr:glycosyltransferase family 4 protein [Armatimonadota bacterium]
MHICYIQFGYPLPGVGGGGAGTYVRMMARELLNEGHRVSVITARRKYPDSVFQEDGYRVRCIDFGHLSYYIGKLPLAGKVARRLAHLRECDLALRRAILDIDAECGIDLIEGCENWFRPPVKTPLIVHLHGSAYTFKVKCGEPVSRADVLQRKLELRTIRRAAQVFAPACHLVEEVRREGGIRVADPYIDPYPMHLPAEPSFLGEKDPANPLILFMGRIERRKGAHLILDAIPAVSAHHPNARFVFAGNMSLDLASRAEAVIKERGEAVRFLSFQPHDELLRLLQKAVISLVPSVWDNAPYTVIESFSRQAVVIGTRVGGIAELLDEGRGLLIDSEDSEALADRICRVLENPVLRESLNRKAAGFMENRVEAKANCRRRMKEYARVIAEYKS